MPVDPDVVPLEDPSVDDDPGAVDGELAAPDPDPEVESGVVVDVEPGDVP